jgi:hypothetical protein
MSNPVINFCRVESPASLHILTTSCERKRVITYLRGIISITILSAKG